MTYYSIKNHLEAEAVRVEDWASTPSEKQINLLAFLMNSRGVNVLDEVPQNSGLTRRQTSRLIDDIKGRPELTIEEAHERSRNEEREQREQRERDNLRAGAKRAEKDENRDAFSSSDIASIKIGTAFTCKIESKGFGEKTYKDFNGTIDRREPRKGRVRMVGFLLDTGGNWRTMTDNIEVARISDIVV